MLKQILLATILGLNQLPVPVQQAGTSQYVTPVGDQAGADHFIVGTSKGTGTYTAQATPTLTKYTTGTWYVFIPDVPTSPTGNTLNIDGLGPTQLVGVCSGVCLLLPEGVSSNPAGPVAQMVVH